MTYINLRVHSHFSIGESFITPRSLAYHCKKNQIYSICLSDYNNLFGFVEMAAQCKIYDLHYIIGAIVNIEYNGIQGHMLLISKNKLGYKNLVYIISDSYTSHANFASPYTNISLVMNNSNGLIILCGCYSNSLFYKLFYNNMLLELYKIIDTINGFFKYNFFLELYRSQKNDEGPLFNFLMDVSIRKNINVVATNPIKRILKQDYHILNVFERIIKSKHNNYNNSRLSYYSYIRSTRDMCELFYDIPAAISNTQVISNQCSHIFIDRKISLPKYSNSIYQDSKALIYYTIISLEKKINGGTNAIRRCMYFSRLHYEMFVIVRMDLSSYFLIVSDFINWSKKCDIPVGPGRGSGSGCIIAWVTGIVNTDPLVFGLMFERFLNPKRHSIPDLDIDFCQFRRNDVIRYIKYRFGASKVARIVTFGKLQARGILKDASKVLKVDNFKINRLCKIIPLNNIKSIILKRIIQLDGRFKKELSTDNSFFKLTSISLSLEGINKSVSMHAAGLVISSTDIINILPLYKEPKLNVVMIQCTLKYTSIIGLIKFDFLGLKALTIVHRIFSIIKTNYCHNICADRLKLDNYLAYKMLSLGYCTGVFQFEGGGIKESMKKVKPKRIEDLVAVGSLYRPGPMNSIALYIIRRYDASCIPKHNHIMGNILRETYGIIVYQEQIIKIAQVAAGYSLAEGDLLRRAVSKKFRSEVLNEQEHFVLKCQNMFMSRRNAIYLFDIIAKFSSYGFNKSHAVSYSYISYQTVFLKSNYTLEFFISVLNLELNSINKVYVFLNEAKFLNILITLPNINKSYLEFSVGNAKTINFGLLSLKIVSKEVLISIIRDRSVNGLYNNIFNFLRRISYINITKNMLHALIKSGALYILKMNRTSLLMNLDCLINYSNKYNFINYKQLTFCSKNIIKKPILEFFRDCGKSRILKGEFESFGYFISSHPLKRYNVVLKHLPFLLRLDTVRMPHNSIFNISGIITDKIIKSVKNGRYAFVQISNLGGILDLMIFDEKVLSKNIRILKSSKVIICKIIIKCSASGLKINILDMNEMNEAISQLSVKINILIYNKIQMYKIRGYIDFYSGIKIDIFVRNFKYNQNIIFVNLENIEKIHSIGIYSYLSK